MLLTEAYTAQRGDGWRPNVGIELFSVAVQYALNAVEPDEQKLMVEVLMDNFATILDHRKVPDVEIKFERAPK